MLQLLEPDPEERLSSLQKLQQHVYMADVSFDDVLNRRLDPLFVPSVSCRQCVETYTYIEIYTKQNIYTCTCTQVRKAN